VVLRHLRRVRWAVRATLFLGVAASVVANVLHALDNPISQAIAAWPPLALLLTVELISRVPVHRRWLAAARLIATATIAGIAAWVSYWHMAGVASRYGETGASPYLLPLSVDGLIVVASICLVELGGRITSLERGDEDLAPRAAQPTPTANSVIPDLIPTPNAPAANTVAADPSRTAGAGTVTAGAVSAGAVSAGAVSAGAVSAATVEAVTARTGGLPLHRRAFEEAAAALPRATNPDGTAFNPTLTRQARPPAPSAGRPTAAEGRPTGRTSAAADGRSGRASAAVDGRSTGRAGAAVEGRAGAAVEGRAGAAVEGRAGAAVDRRAGAAVDGQLSVAHGRDAGRAAPARDGGSAGRVTAGAGRAVPAQRSSTTVKASAGRAAGGDQAGGNSAPRTEKREKARRSPAETVAIADRLKAERPAITDAEIAAELGITTSRLRTVRRETQSTDHTLAA
jgi:hypothetical protein